VPPQLLGNLVIGISALAAREEPLLAEEAFATGDRKGHYDSVANLELAVFGTDLDDFTHGLVTEDVALFHRGHDAIEQMQVRAADGAGGDLDDGVSAVLDLRVRHRVASNVVLPVPSQGSHPKSPCRKICRDKFRREDRFLWFEERQLKTGVRGSIAAEETNMPASRPFAIVTGASTGIGLELARRCANEGYDLLIAADEPEIEQAAASLRAGGAEVQSLQVDLATTEGVDKLYAAAKGRPVDALLANAGRGLGHAFLDQDFGKARRVVDTNITGTIYLIHKVGNDMRRRNSGRILIVGSIAGFTPGSFQAVYNGTKAFLNSFSFALREELKDTKITVTCLMPGATETEFFRRAEMMDTAVGTAEKDDPAEVANIGFDAMMKGEGDVVSGLKNKIQSAAANVTPAGVLASQHRKMAEPGTAKK